MTHQNRMAMLSENARAEICALIDQKYAEEFPEGDADRETLLLILEEVSEAKRQVEECAPQAAFTTLDRIESRILHVINAPRKS